MELDSNAGLDTETYKFDVLWQAKWKLWKMTTDAWSLKYLPNELQLSWYEAAGFRP